ncbi:MAG: cellulase family glycosylhydrolase [Mariniphaga sp.]
MEIIKTIIGKMKVLKKLKVTLNNNLIPTHIKVWVILVSFLFIQLPGMSNILSINQDNKPKKTIPYTLPWNDMPIDLSFVYAKDKPAGKHGFLKVEGDKFVFENGTEGRFWGTNFNSAQCFPSHEHSEKVAKRLAKVGINMVRFHQLDGEWSTPNIFQFSRGENKDNTQSFDPESMDRLDYLIYCLKKEGVYVYMDLLTYRRFKTGDGVEVANKLGDAAKPYSTYNRRLIELQKKFNADLWTHINPYTKLAYKDEPAIVLTEITNECDLWSQNVTVEPYRTELEDLYRDWAFQNKVKVGESNVVFNKEDADIQKFFIDVTTAYYKEMIAHMRDIGVKIPVAGTNWTRNAAHLTAQVVADFTDSHAYYYNFGLWGDGSKRFMNASMTGSMQNMIPGLAFYKVQDKPFFVSEWDNPWPNEWRAESSLLLAAAGAMQGWGGFAIHTYRYTLDENVDMIAKPLTGDALNGVYYRGGLFDTFNDPAKFGLFYHAALIMRRGDVSPAEKTLNVKLENLQQKQGKALLLTAEKHKVETVLPDMTPKGDIIVSTDEEVVELDKKEVLSDTKELYRNLNKKIGWIDSPRTKAIYGFVGKEDNIKLNDVNFEVKTDFATIAISSLNDKPINVSGNMLLTAVGRAENTNSKYNNEHTQVLDVGEGPILVEVIEATIEINTNKKNLRVMSVNPQGLITGYMPSEYQDGVFRFEIGKEFQSMYYLIQEM